MWPTENTIDLLFLGLLPLAYIAYRIVRYGVAEIVSMRAIGILFVWMGYHLSAWIVYVTDERWMNFLLVPSLIDEVLLFSSLCMVAFLLGFHAVSKNTAYHLYHSNKVEQLKIPNIKRKWLLWLSLMSMGSFIFSVHGLDEILRSSVPRGHLDARFFGREGGFIEQIRHVVKILSPIAAITLACMAALYVFGGKHLTVERLLIGGLCLLVGSLEGIWSFSRDAGMPFLIFAFIALWVRGSRALGFAITASVLVYFLGSIGLEQRGKFYPGLANFADAAVQYVSNEKRFRDENDGISVDSNPLGSVEAWTKKISLLPKEENSDIELIGKFILRLQPFPSAIVPIPEIGPDLTVVMKSVGRSGITTPAYAEIYYALGYGGLIVIFIVGGIMAWFEGVAKRKPNVVTLVCVLLCFISWPLGLHNGIRAMTRPLLYAYILYWLSNQNHVKAFLYRRRHRSKRLLSKSDC